MARPVKIGFEYFPCDVNLPNDIKVRRLIKRKGGGAVWVYLCALSLIYKGGYYVDFNSDTPFVLSELTGFDEDYVSDVINSCMELDLFSKEVFDRFGVLTSTGIQRRYIAICQSSKRKMILDKYILVSSEETLVNTEEIMDSSEESAINSEFSTQSKVKKSKVKKSKVEEGQNKGLISRSPLPPIDFTAFVESYNKAVEGKGISVQRLTTKRKQSIQELLSVYSYQDYETVLLKIKESRFMWGANSKKWKVTFDWLIEQDNFIKVLEGHYDNTSNCKAVNQDNCEGIKI